MGEVRRTRGMPNKKMHDERSPEKAQLSLGLPLCGVPLWSDSSPIILIYFLQKGLYES